MADQIEKFDPSTLMQGVKDRIKATFVSLIPDDKWEEMCKSEIESFFKGTPTDRWGNPGRPSEFNKIIQEVLKEKCRAYIVDLLNKPEYSVAIIWEYNQVVGHAVEQGSLSAHLDALIKAEMPKLLEAMISRTISDAMAGFIQGVQNRLKQGY